MAGNQSFVCQRGCSCSPAECRRNNFASAITQVTVNDLTGQPVKIRVYVYENGDVDAERT